ncbi:hypothetical protein TNCV_2255101 [Trichonephila clavipes]|nr:hypothetical protein TNCV_2255101 [Trichonephila clavipes]
MLSTRGEKPTPFIEHRINTRNHLPVADMLSRPVTQEESFCENNITIADMPTRVVKTCNMQTGLNVDFDESRCFLYRYVPDADSAEAQLVIPTAERELIMERHHNDPMAGHYGEEEHSENRQTILLDRHEKVNNGYSLSRIVPQSGLELCPFSSSARQCATTLIKFSRVMAYQDELSVTMERSLSVLFYNRFAFTLNISQNFIPVYSPQSNPVERKTETLNPDLQYLLETIILVGIPNSSHTFCHEYNCL